ncbi:MAG: ACP S-malonyltransferase [Alphaproteobacteria bacterium]|nr:ACP S-malonyltransferase [Alphaproteobacteria bacterium]
MAARRAFLFPGQGSQQVGMGQALADSFAAAREVFQEVDEALKDKLSRLMFEGPEDHLTLTANAQPALMAVSVAVMRLVEKEGGKSLGEIAQCVAGHSLGEYSALTAAGSLGLADAARLLRLRGESMQRAVPVGTGAMAAILMLDLDAVRAIAAQAAKESGATCDVANDNAPGQVVVSGAKAAVEKAVELATKHGEATKARVKCMMLPVSAPFHCAMMKPAAEVMAEALAKVTLRPPAVPVVANVTAAPVATPDEIRRLLVEQVCSTVRWRESVLRMKADGIETAAELGAGKVLAGLVKRIDKDVAATSVGTPQELEAFLKTL